MPNLPKLTLFGLPLVDATPDKAVAALMAAKGRAAFINAHCINVAARDAAYRTALDTADLLLPDGAGMAMAARLNGARFSANLNGTDLVPMLMQKAGQEGASVYLFGAAPGVAARAAVALQTQAPGLRIAGTRDGFAARDGAVDAINASRAEILLVALGVPAQDVWLAENADALNVRLSLGVGALFDFMAGEVPRAPLWLRRARMEWLWRLVIEPRRMAGRYLVGNLTFIARAIANRNKA